MPPAGTPRHARRLYQASCLIFKTMPRITSASGGGSLFLGLDVRLAGRRIPRRLLGRGAVALLASSSEHPRAQIPRARGHRQPNCREQGDAPPRNRGFGGHQLRARAARGGLKHARTTRTRLGDATREAHRVAQPVGAEEARQSRHAPVNSGQRRGVGRGLAARGGGLEGRGFGQLSFAMTVHRPMRARKKGRVRGNGAG